MLLVVCAIRDSAVAAYSRPFVVPAVGMAVRGFGDEVSRQDSEMFKHPSDYELFEIGTFDEESGKMVSYDHPRSLARGADYAKGGGSNA